MSKAETIEEIGGIVSNTLYACKEQSECDRATCPDCVAFEIYNAGFRKQLTGHWSGIGWDHYCSLCCMPFTRVDRYNYCPNCGAKME